jgi:hypothetical protein
MNCKPGDLAVVRENGPDDGKIVRVVGPGDFWGDIGDWRVHWTCDTLGQRVTFDPNAVHDGSLMSDGTELVDYADSDLIPIRGGDGEDETLTWAGKPQTVTA